MGIWQFTEAFAVSQRQSELKISEANAGAKLPECIACPDNNRDQPANEQACVMRSVYGCDKFAFHFSFELFSTVKTFKFRL